MYQFQHLYSNINRYQKSNLYFTFNIDYYHLFRLKFIIFIDSPNFIANY